MKFNEIKDLFDYEDYLNDIAIDNLGYEELMYQIWWNLENCTKIDLLETILDDNNIEYQEYEED